MIRNKKIQKAAALMLHVELWCLAETGRSTESFVHTVSAVKPRFRLLAASITNEHLFNRAGQNWSRNPARTMPKHLAGGPILLGGESGWAHRAELLAASAGCWFISRLLLG